MGRHDAAWLAGVEAHVREARAGEALRRHGAGGGGARAAAAAVAREAWLLEKVEASVFARVLQDIEDVLSLISVRQRTGGSKAWTGVWPSVAITVACG